VERWRRSGSASGGEPERWVCGEIGIGISQGGEGRGASFPLSLSLFFVFFSLVLLHMSIELVCFAREVQCTGCDTLLSSTPSWICISNGKPEIY